MASTLAMTLQFVALAVIVSASIVQLSLEHFWKDQPIALRRRWARFLIGLVVAGAVATAIATWQAHSSAREEQSRIERMAEEQESRARSERQAISAQIEALVTLARERDPNLSEEEALRTITTELLSLRQQTSQLEHDVLGLQRYSKVARYNVLGLTGRAGRGLTENSPIALALEGAYLTEDGSDGPNYSPRCDAQALARFANVAEAHPDFPFSHWALASCLRRSGDPEWREHASRAVEILQHTTKIAGHSDHHDQALHMLNAQLAQQ